MKLLSQREEQLMLAVWALKEEAYLVAIKKYLSDMIGKNWTLAGLHSPLQHLEDRGFLESYLGEATSVRGGRAKRIYRITQSGFEALAQNKMITDALWANFPDLNIS